MSLLVLGRPTQVLSSAPPAVLSLAAAAAGILAALSAWQERWLLALGLFLLGRLVDGLDGAVARLTESASDAGGYLDITLDTVAYAAIVLGIAGGLGTKAAWTAASFALASFYVNTISWAYLAALLEKHGFGASSSDEATSITMPRGLVEGAETIVFFVAMLIFPAAAVTLLWIMAVLVSIGAVVRAGAGIRALKQLGHRSEGPNRGVSYG